MRPTTVLYTVVLLATSALALPFPALPESGGMSSSDIAPKSMLTDSKQSLKLHQKYVCRLEK